MIFWYKRIIRLNKMMRDGAQLYQAQREKETGEERETRN
jgi:hypothetical protein